MASRLSGILSGVAGEYFVAAELSRRDYIASITLRNTEGVDVLASSPDASRSVSIQVKTNRGDDRRWLMGRKAETYCADSLFYVFVNLRHGDHPTFHVVPSRVVAEQVSKGHAARMVQPGRDGRPRRDSGMRSFQDKRGRYLDRWDLLGLGGGEEQRGG